MTELNCNDDVIATLRSQVESLETDLERANGDATKAAEYGMLALDEKDQLQKQYDQLEAVLSQTKQEFNSTVDVLEELQGDRARREQQEEKLRSNLAVESEKRELLLVDKNNDLQRELTNLRQELVRETARRQMAEAEAKQLEDRESERVDRNGVDRAAEAQRHHRKSAEEINQLREKLAELDGIQVKSRELELMVKSSRTEGEKLSELVSRLTLELEQAELDTSRAYASLKDEQERCHRLESRVEEMEVSASLANGSASGGVSMLSELTGARMFSPEAEEADVDPMAADAVRPPMIMMTPGGGGVGNNSLMDELNDTVDSVQQERVAELEQQLDERAATIGERNVQLSGVQAELRVARGDLADRQSALDSLRSEIAGLRRTVETVCVDGERLSAAAVSDAISSLRLANSKLRDDLQDERKALKSAKEDLARKEDLLTGEHSDLLKKLEILEAERAAVQLEGEEKYDKLRIELFQARDENGKLLAAQTDAEQKYTEGEKRWRSLESDSSEQRAALARDIQNVMADVEGMSRLASSLAAQQGGGGAASSPHSTPAASPSKQATDPGQLVTALRDKVRVVRSTVESVLRASLEHHRVAGNSAAATAMTGAATSTRASDANWSDESKREAQMRFERLKRELKAKTKDVEVLHLMMATKTRTAHAAVLRVKASAELKIREADDRAVRALASLERTQRDFSDFAVMRSTFADRCQEHIRREEQFKATVAELKKEKSELNMLLERAIVQKLNLRERLEEYEVENERMYSIPQALQPTKV